MYQHVIVMENPNNTRFNKIIVAKGAGIVQLEEKDGTIWKTFK